MKCSTEKRVTSLAIVGERPTKSSANNMDAWKHEVRPTIVCGLNIRCSLGNRSRESSINIMDVDQQLENSCLYLVVYDFQYKKEYDDLDFMEPATDNKNDTVDLSKVFGWTDIPNPANETQMETVSNGSNDTSLEIKVRIRILSYLHVLFKPLYGKMFRHCLPFAISKLFF